MYKNVLVTGGIVSSLLLTGASTTFAQSNPISKQHPMHHMVSTQRFVDMATKLGLNADEVKQELTTGKKWPDILKEHNITSAQIKQTLGVKKAHFGKKQGMRMLKMAPELLQAQANVLGMTTDELQTALKNKQKMQDIVTSKGMTMEQFHQKVNEQIKQMIADGKITGNQAAFYQKMLDHENEQEQGN